MIIARNIKTISLILNLNLVVIYGIIGIVAAFGFTSLEGNVLQVRLSDYFLCFRQQ